MRRHQEAELVTEFVLKGCARRQSTAWLGSQLREHKPSPTSTALIRRLESLNMPLTAKTRDRLVGLETFADLFRSFQLKAVREDSLLGLLGWLEGHYPLELWYRQPTPHEMLAMQAEGRRVVTLFTDPADQDRKIGRHAGAYEFCLHDLEHAEKFFGGETQGQIRFFQWLSHSLQAGLFQELIEDPQFAGELDYLMADMNSHPVHLMKYLKAIAIGVFERRLGRGTPHFDEWCEKLFTDWNFGGEVLASALRLNYPQHERLDDRVLIANHFQGAL